MANFKIIVSDPSSGKSQVVEAKENQAQPLVGMKIGDVFDGTIIGVNGKVKITGGSDKAGFPMRSDVSGGAKKYVLLTKGVGFSSAEKGAKKRKLVRGNIITEEIYQLNAIQVKETKAKPIAENPKTA
ncbi:MAG: 30S ribosomal protein S6e [Thaumarchaeota archaeon]|nr:30S ribosomal protein S6e [Nitrososphaerota archaeon]